MHEALRAARLGRSNEALLQPGVLFPFLSVDAVRRALRWASWDRCTVVKSCVYRWMEFLARKTEWDDEKMKGQLKKNPPSESLRVGDSRSWLCAHCR